MNLFALPWLELSLAVGLVGSACVCLVRDAVAAFRWCVAFAAVSLGCVSIAALAFFLGHAPHPNWGVWDWAGRRLLAVDELNAPLLPVVALLQLLTILTTARTKMIRFSFAGALVGGGVRLAAFACVVPWLLVLLLALDAALPVLEIRRRGGSGRLSAIHAALFVGLLVAGWWCTAGATFPAAGAVLLLVAAAVRTGLIPAQVWVTDVFESGSFGTAMLFTAPLAAGWVIVRLAFPLAPGWAVESFGVVALVTAAYTAGVGVIQTDARRFFACLCVSHTSLVLVGFGLQTPIAVTGSLVMWMSAAVSLTGLGLTLRAVEARVGPLSLTEFRGLYGQAPALAVCFLMTGLAAVGFPGTSGFVAIELLVDEAVGSHEAVGLVVVLTSAVNGIGVVRAYLLLFTGRRHMTGVSLGITLRERIAVVTVVALILAGGVFPQAYIESRHRAAQVILRWRTPPPEPAIHW
jgi:NADH-quinone oxidoreductase subunit M